MIIYSHDFTAGPHPECRPPIMAFKADSPTLKYSFGVPFALYATGEGLHPTEFCASRTALARCGNVDTKDT